MSQASDQQVAWIVETRCEYLASCFVKSSNPCILLIMNGRGKHRLRLLLACNSVLAVATPLVFGFLAAAQVAGGSGVPADARPSFEVASIRASRIGQRSNEGSSRSRVEYAPNGVRMTNVNVKDCIQWAYGVPFYQLSGPKSLDRERYDVVAKAEAPVTVNQLRLMMRSLLASRFKLVLHPETKALAVYELVVVKGGPKLASLRTAEEATTLHSSESLPEVHNGSFVFQNTSMAEFAEKLSQLRGIDRPVVDRTALRGSFNFTLNSAADALLDPSGASLFTLIHEQLGLKLVPAKAPLEVLVIDRAETPSEN